MSDHHCLYDNLTTMRREHYYNGRLIEAIYVEALYAKPPKRPSGWFYTWQAGQIVGDKAALPHPHTQPEINDGLATGR